MQLRLCTPGFRYAPPTSRECKRSPFLSRAQRAGDTAIRRRKWQRTVFNEAPDFALRARFRQEHPIAEKSTIPQSRRRAVNLAIVQGRHDTAKMLQDLRSSSIFISTVKGTTYKNGAFAAISVPARGVRKGTRYKSDGARLFTSCRARYRELGGRPPSSDRAEDQRHDIQFYSKSARASAWGKIMRSAGASRCSPRGLPTGSGQLSVALTCSRNRPSRPRPARSMCHGSRRPLGRLRVVRRASQRRSETAILDRSR